MCCLFSNPDVPADDFGPLILCVAFSVTQMFLQMISVPWYYVLPFQSPRCSCRWFRSLDIMCCLFSNPDVPADDFGPLILCVAFSVTQMFLQMSSVPCHSVLPFQSHSWSYMVGVPWYFLVGYLFGGPCVPVDRPIHVSMYTMGYSK